MIRRQLTQEELMMDKSLQEQTQAVVDLYRYLKNYLSQRDALIDIGIEGFVQDTWEAQKQVIEQDYRKEREARNMRACPSIEWLSRLRNKFDRIDALQPLIRNQWLAFKNGLDTEFMKQTDASAGVSTFLETDAGDGTATESTVTYTFPSGVAGNYTFYANISGATVNPSYTVSVSAPSFSPSASYDVTGRTVDFTITAGAPIYGTYLYVSGAWHWHLRSSASATTQTLSYTFPDTTSPGTYTMSLYVYPRVGNTYGQWEAVYHYVRLSE